MNKYLLILIALALATGIYAIEVGGHISHNTTWSPENNPYNVTSFLYIDSHVTLTILPGTEIRVWGMDKSIIWDFMWNGNTEPLAKMIIVNGKIEAIGTPEQPITFDKMQENSEIRWGSIYISPNAPASIFEYCEFRNSFFCDYVPGEWSLAAIQFDNGVVKVRSCVFENNLGALHTGFLQSDLLLYDCKFISLNDSYPNPFAFPGFLGLSAAPQPVPEQNYQVTIAKCYFTGAASFGPVGYYMDILRLNNVVQDFTSRDEQAQGIRSEYGSTYSYGNISYNGNKGWGCSSATETDTVYARRNRMIKPTDPGDTPISMGGSGFGTNYVSDNYMYGNVRVQTLMTNATTVYMYNNIIEKTHGYEVLRFENRPPSNQGGQMRFFNNLVRYIGTSESNRIAIVRNSSPLLYNNSFIGFRNLGTFYAYPDQDSCEVNFTNNILDLSRGLTESHNFNAGYILNNCLTNPILENSQFTYIDNIIADPVFADTLSGDYSLQAESPCIDAGIFRPDLPAFDIRYHKRISPHGVRAVDIGAYEYNSVYIGGINGNVYDAETGEVVDCVKIEITQKLPEFSDTLGCFQYPTGAGIYEVRASRWDYHDRVIRNVTVIEGADTILSIPLSLLTVSNEDEQIPSGSLLPDLKNYPNPFNPQTTISFILPEAGTVKLSLYNLKGQIVKALHNGPLAAGNHNFVWNGCDTNGRAVSSGLYFARIEQGNTHRIHKMMLLK